MKKFIIKLTVFLIILLFLQSFLTLYLLEIDDPRLKKYVFRFDEYTRLNKYLREKRDVIYFGDSTVYMFGKGDTDKRKMWRMLADSLMPDYSLGNITHAAYHMDLYLEFCRYITRRKTHPQVIIIPINMRSFSPEFDMRPQYQFEIEKIFLRGGISRQLLLAFYKPLRAFSYDFSTVRREDFLNAPVFDGTRQVGVVSDFNNRSYFTFSEKNLKNIFIFFYMYALDPGHRKLKSLEETAAVLSKHNIHAVFYTTPIDYQTGEKHFPGRFTKLVKSNTELIRSVLARGGAELLDLSTRLSSDGFTWRMYPNEYLNQKGRRFVVESLRRRVLKLISPSG
jgi:hypothetical protein